MKAPAPFDPALAEQLLPVRDETEPPAARRAFRLSRRKGAAEPAEAQLAAPEPPAAPQLAETAEELAPEAEPVSVDSAAPLEIDGSDASTTAVAEAPAKASEDDAPGFLSLPRWMKRKG